MINQPFQTPMAHKQMPFISPIQEQSMQSPYQNLFTIRNRQLIPSNDKSEMQEQNKNTKPKEKKKITITKPPTQVKFTQVKQKILDQQLDRQSRMIELIRENQDLKVQLMNVEREIQQFKQLILQKKQ